MNQRTNFDAVVGNLALLAGSMSLHQPHLWKNMSTIPVRYKFAPCWSPCPEPTGIMMTMTIDLAWPWEVLREWEYNRWDPRLRHRRIHHHRPTLRLQPFTFH
jgi:hypothetical protein